MNSHRRYLFLFIFCFVGLVIFLYYRMVELSTWESALAIVLIYPILQKIVIVVYHHFVIKEMLYLFVILTCLEASINYFFIKDFDLLDLAVLYLCKTLAVNVLNVAIERISDWAALSAYHFMQVREAEN